MKIATLCALGALIVSTLACSIFVGGPSYPTETAATPTPNGLSLQQEVEQAVANASTTGVVTIQITEAQLTSYLATSISGEAHPVLSDPQVILQDNHMVVYGKATSGIFTANVSTTVQVSIDSAGQPQIQVENTDFGPLSAPQSLNDAIAASIQEAFTGWAGPVATGFRLDTVTIANGVMTVTGRIK